MSTTKINSHMLQVTIEDHGAQFADALEDRALKRARKVRTARVKQMKSVAPVKTGRYRDGIRGEVKRTPGEITVEIGGTDRKTHWIEYGTREMKPRPVITKGMEGIEDEFAAGLVEDADKIKDLC